MFRRSLLLLTAGLCLWLAGCAPSIPLWPTAISFVHTDLQPQALVPGLQPQTLWVTCLKANSAYEIKTNPLALGLKLSLPAGPSSLILDSQRQAIYCLHWHANIISVLSGNPLGVEKSLSTGDIPLASGALRPHTDEMWICDGVSALVVLVPKAMSMKDRVQVGRYPQKIVFSEDGQTAWVTVKGENALVSWNVKERREAGRVAIGIYPRDIVLAGKVAAVSNFGSHDVSLVDVEKMQEIIRLKVRRQPNSMALQGRTLWVACEDSYRLIAIDLDQQKVTGTIKLGFYPGAILALPDHSLAVADPKNNRVALVTLK